MSGNPSAANQQKCPNCDTMTPGDMVMCPRCGMTLSASSKTIYGCAILLFQGFLGLSALAFGASGTCFSLFNFSLGPAAHDFWLPGVPLFILTALCIWGIVRISKARKRL